ncbi:hypothetical protein V5O48_017819, partial [Marasmius crinis-equi]
MSKHIDTLASYCTFSDHRPFHPSDSYPRDLPRPADIRNIDIEPIIAHNPGRYHNKWVLTHRATWWFATSDIVHSHYSLIRITWDIDEDAAHIETIQHVSITEKVLPHQAVLADIIPVENLPVTPITAFGQPTTLTSVSRDVFNDDLYLVVTNREGDVRKLKWDPYPDRNQRHGWYWEDTNAWLNQEQLDWLQEDPTPRNLASPTDQPEQPEQHASTSSEPPPPEMSGTRTVDPKTEPPAGTSGLGNQPTTNPGDEGGHPGSHPSDSSSEPDSSHGTSKDSWRGPDVGAPSSDKERGVKPTPFTGDRSKSELFLVQFGRYLRFNASRYETEMERVDLFLSFIEGNAGDWAVRRSQELEKDYLDSDLPDYKRRWTSLKSIRHRFRQDYGPINPEGTAQTVLDEISMTGDLAEIDKYITEFERHAPLSGYNDVALLHYFKRGLKKGLRTACAQVYPEPSTLEAYKEVA